MNVSLPYFRRRRYLTGIDWVVGALHESGKKTIGLGAMSQAVIDVAGRLDDVALRAALDQISKRFPIIHGRFARDWFNLAPYWKIPRSARAATILLNVVDLAGDADDRAQQLLADHVNTPLDSDSTHIRFLLIRVDDRRSLLGLVFDHRFLDAYGAESLFRLIDETFHGRLEEVAGKIKVTEPAHLDHWKRRFASGKLLNRMLFKLQEKDVRALAKPPAQSSSPGRIRFVHDRLTADESARAQAKTFEEISVPILLPSAAARAVSAVREAVPNPPLEGDQYLLFTSANMRLPGQEWEMMLFNRFSFLVLTAPVEPMGIPQLAGELRDQLFSHMKDKIPSAMEDAAALGRICPRSLVARVINSMFKGRMCSFYFACLKESGFAREQFMGLPASDLYHTPLAFVPPGVNLCLTAFAGRFNIVLSYLQDSLSDKSAHEIVRRFKASLVN